MKIIVDKSRFQSALNSVKDVASGAVLQILNNVKLEAHNEEVTLITTNLDVVVKTTIPCRVEEEGVTTVPAKLCSSAVGVVTASTVAMETMSTGKVSLKGGETVFKMAYIDAKEFPAPAAVDKPNEVTILMTDLARIMRETAYAACQDKTRPRLQCVCLKFDGKGGISAAASDGKRAAVASGTYDGKLDAETEILMPIPSITMLQRFLSSGDNNARVKIQFTHLAAIFSTAEWSFQTKLVDEDFPNVNSVIPKSFDETVSVDRVAFIMALKQVLVAVGKEPSVKLSLSNNMMIITGKDSDVSDARAAFPVKYSGADKTIVLQPMYVLDVLNALTDDDVEFKITNATSPIGVCATSYVGVIMPMRQN